MPKSKDPFSSQQNNRVEMRKCEDLVCTKSFRELRLKKVRILLHNEATNEICFKDCEFQRWCGPVQQLKKRVSSPKRHRTRDKVARDPQL